MAKWTKEQQQAIALDQKNILVSAAAGSGKTAVLVERVVSHLLRPETEADSWDVDKLLVVTFTKAAAAEMSERIGKSLQDAIAKELAKEEQQQDKKLISRLQKQVILLSSASISTIDSFCQTIIKNNFDALGDLDPKFRVAEENELQLLKQDVLEEMFEARYDEGDAKLLHLGDQYGSDHGDGPLYEIILGLHEQAMNQPFPEEWLTRLAEDFPGRDGQLTKLKECTHWWPVIMEALQLGMSRAWDCYRGMALLVAEVEDKKARDKFQERLDRANGILTKITEALQQDWEDIYQAFRDLDYKETAFQSLPGGKLNLDPELRSQIKDANTAMKDAVTALKDTYILDQEQVMVEDLQAIAQDVDCLVELTLDFAQRFAAAKREKNIIDYGDMEHFALQVLLAADSTPEKPLPSAVALSLRDRYQEIMVDEYQDTNEVQDTIVRLIAGEEGGNLFIVGDVKQSIYGFRASEPGLFMAKYDNYGQAGQQEHSELITLGRNFRSRKEILSAVNFIFAQVMTREPMEISYDEKAMLNPGEPYGYGEPGTGEIMPLTQAVELAILAENGVLAEENGEGETEVTAAKGESSEEEPEGEEEELKSFQLEAQYIAQRLKELKAAGYQVFDKDCNVNNGYRDIRWKDMVILLRSTSGKAEILQEILQANDIPVYANTSGGYFQATEIQVMTSLLAIIDNAQQDIPLAAVLYSPIVGLDTEELAQIRLTDKDGNLYQAMLASNSPESQLAGEIKGRLAAFLTQLSGWRQLAQRIGVPELLWQLYQDTGYYDYVGCMPGGVLRQANLRMLMTRAREFEQTDFRGLFRFLGFLDKIQAMDNDLSVARTMGENEDVVRVMTIHKSKGLEFPVVVLADMAKRFNQQDLTQAVLVHKKLGLGLDCFDLDRSVKYPSFGRMAVKAQLMQESKAEELRVLYVALTRAREKLIMVGCVKDIGRAAGRWCQHLDYVPERLAQGLDVNAGKALLHQTLPRYVLEEANSYLDWVGPAVARHREAAVLAPYIGMSEEEYAQHVGHMANAMGIEAHWQVNVVATASLRAQQQAAAAEGDDLAIISRGERFKVAEAVGRRVAEVLDWRYDYQGTRELPAKLSVSDIKRRFAAEMAELEAGQQAMAQKEQRTYSFPRPQFLQRQDESQQRRTSGAEYGTLMHSVMQHLKLAGQLDEADVREQLQQMVEREIITQDQLQLVNVRQVVSFWASAIGQRMVKAKSLWRELPFSRMLEASDYYDTASGARIFNQGVIDVLFEEADGSLILLDYKTDRDTAPETVKAKYQKQLELYAQAVEGILGRKVRESYLYMLRDNTLIELA